MKKFISLFAFAILFISCREVENITTENQLNIITEMPETTMLKTDSISTAQNNTLNSTTTEEAPKDPPRKDKEDW